MTHLEYAFFDINNFHSLTPFEKHRLSLLTKHNKSNDSDINCNIKLLLKYNDYFQLKDSDIRKIARYFACINDDSLSAYNNLLNSIIAMNIRLCLMTTYIKELSDSILNLLTTAFIPGFVIISKDRIQSKYFKVIRSFNVERVKNDISSSDVFRKLAEGTVLIIDSDFPIVCEKFSVSDSSSIYPDLLNYLDLLVYKHNHLILRYKSIVSSSKTQCAFKDQLFRAVVKVSTISDVKIACVDKQMIIDGAYKLLVHVVQGNTKSDVELISHIYIDTSQFSQFNLFDAIFDISFASMNDVTAKDILGNLLFRSEPVTISNRLRIVDETPASVQLSVLATSTVLDNEVNHPTFLQVQSVLQKTNFFISIIGTKGAGKSKFIKCLQEKYSDIFYVDSDMYGSYLYRIFALHGHVSFTMNDLLALPDMDVRDLVDIYLGCPKEPSDDVNNYLPNVMINYLNSSNTNPTQHFMNYLVKLYDHKICGLRRYQDVCATVAAQHFDTYKIIIFSHIITETYYEELDAQITLIPCYMEFDVLSSRKREYALHVHNSLYDVELVLYTTYLQYLSKRNTFGWLTIYNMFGLDLRVDLTYNCLNMRYKYMDEYNNDEIGTNHILLTPKYQVSRPLLLSGFPRVSGVLLLPIGHGKTTLSNTSTKFIEIDHCFSNSDFVYLFHVAHYTSYYYLKEFTNIFLKYYDQGCYDGKVVLYHNTYIGDALYFRNKAFILNINYIQTILSKKVSYDRLTNIINSVNDVVETCDNIEIFEDHDSLMSKVKNLFG
ncbi:89.2 kDa protein [Psammotettix alienus reovirus]|nr:89.2 kDa protein [Psammotettix alienus reovirus]